MTRNIFKQLRILIFKTSELFMLQDEVHDFEGETEYKRFESKQTNTKASAICFVVLNEAYFLAKATTQLGLWIIQNIHRPRWELPFASYIIINIQQHSHSIHHILQSHRRLGTMEDEAESPK